MNKKSRLLSKLFLFSAFIAGSSELYAASVISNLNMKYQHNSAQCVIKMSAPMQFKKIYLAKNPRLVLDFQGGRIKNPQILAIAANPLVKRVRYGYKPNKVLRLVFDLNNQVNISARNHNTTLVLNFTGKSSNFTINPPSTIIVSTPIKTNESTLPKPNWSMPPAKEEGRARHIYSKAPTLSRAPKPTSIDIPLQNGLARKMVVVVIDPGHGGKDPGAVGPQGIPEKAVVLSIAKALQKAINNQPGFTAKLTRNGDYYLPLRERLALARRYRGDMFIAIHADAHPRNDPNGNNAHGASVYALSLRGATSEAARWLAKRENESELMGGVDLNDKSNMLKSVLLNLSQDATIQASLRIGDEIIDSLRNVGGLHRHRVEQAAFVVLKSPDIPSLLVETGYITNPREEFNLANGMYQQRLASAITQGVRSYFVQWPPRDSLLAALKYQSRIR